jgi:hypothetical protein
MPGFDSGGSGFGGGGGSGSGLMANAGVRRNGPSMSSAPQPVGNQGPRGGSKLMIGLIEQGGGVASLTLHQENPMFTFRTFLCFFLLFCKKAK